jgi:tetratricopeptide (TPR) repeat protein
MSDEPSRETRAEAQRHFQQGYEAQMQGRLEEAVAHYQRSIALHPTAEAHTFLGWAYSHQGRPEDAIAQCKIAIGVDPDFGNPYNDIGAYLIERGELDAAIPWLQKAKEATRYEAPQFPRFNLGRLYLAKDMLSAALREFEEALEVRPGSEPAVRAIAAVKRRLN